MNKLTVEINVAKELYLKNPNSSELGRKIISNSIELIDKLGFELFTFKKLSIRIGSPESSIYRYFENKHMLLVYLTNWYWSWVEHKIVLATLNVEVPIQKLEKAIAILTRPVLADESISYIDEVILNRIIIAESVKAIHTKEVDRENKKGYFETYKYMVNRVAAIVLEVNPDFQYPRMLISTLVEGAHQQRYFLAHLPALTDSKKGEDSITTFYMQLVFGMLYK
jgi:AcrR family transcriptional regulator